MVEGSFNKFISRNQRGLMLESPGFGHRLRFLNKLRKRNAWSFGLDIARIAGSTAVAIFLFSTIAPALFTFSAPEPELETINGIADDCIFYRQTRKKRLYLTPTQIQQASYNLKQLGFESEDEEEAEGIGWPLISTIYL